ncbi:MAG: hypothetical protein GX786_10625, partial [Clostridiales bacterium]|nr:hypothetical protein [Clostridiales bacterium]
MLLHVCEALRNPGEIFFFSMNGNISPQDVLGDQVRFDQVHLTGTFSANEEQEIEIVGQLTTKAYSIC